MKHLGDITTISGYDVPPVDVITGGSPCQDLSVAGLRKGLSGERSGLFMEQIRIIKEMRSRYVRIRGSDQLVRLPRFCIWENVPGAFSSNGGKDFQAVISEFVRVAEPDAPDVPMPEKGKWPKSGCVYDDLGKWSVAWRLHDAQFWGTPKRRKRIALVADFGGLAAPEILFERKGLSRDTEPGGAQGKGTAGAAESGAGTAEPVPLESNQNHATVQTDGVSTTLPASMGMGGGYVPMVIESKGGNQIPVALCAKAYESHSQDSRYNPLGDICETISAKYGTGGNNQPLVVKMHDAYQNVCRTGSVVRRLTPDECASLQGFPRDWCNIGEWTDSKGKKHKDADSPKYKAYGNSIAVGYANRRSGFWCWLARRICAQYERQITMASLFDGIGGFPLAFQAAGAIPVWASEIEEFPIAVTKYHFPEEEEDDESV